MQALVVGGTGATGREIVGQLLKSSKWQSVTSIGRRSVDLPLEYQDVDRSKLKEVIVNMDNLSKEGQEAFKGADVVFCTLGTTRDAAGSAEAFVKVDLTYVEETAKLAKAAGVPRFSLLTAQGAMPNMWGPSIKPLHSLLYMQTKGRAEEAVKAQGFEQIAIFRPGLLNRNNDHRFLEKVALKLTTGLNVRDLARVMISEAEKAITAKSTGLQMHTMQDILKQI